MSGLKFRVIQGQHDTGLGLIELKGCAIQQCVEPWGLLSLGEGV